MYIQHWIGQNFIHTQIKESTMKFTVERKKTTEYRDKIHAHRIWKYCVYLASLICYDFCLRTSQTHWRILHKIKYKYNSTRQLFVYVSDTGWLLLFSLSSPSHSSCVYFLVSIHFSYLRRSVERERGQKNVLYKHLHTGEMLLKRNVIVCEWQLEV